MPDENGRGPKMVPRLVENPSARLDLNPLPLDSPATIRPSPGMVGEGQVSGELCERGSALPVRARHLPALNLASEPTSRGGPHARLHSRRRAPKFTLGSTVADWQQAENAGEPLPRAALFAAVLGEHVSS